MRTILSTGNDPLRFSRRLFTASVAALAIAPKGFAQAPAGGKADIKLRKLHCFEIRVTDVDRSVRFYQGLFGMPVQARTKDRVCLRIGDGPGFMAVRAVREGERPAITYLGYSVEDYEPGRVLGALNRVGFEKIDAPPITRPGIDHPMSAWMRMRAQTPEVYFSDARGLIVQLSDPGYCGGAACGPIEPAPEGVMKLHELNHFTAFVNDGAAANRFYQETFGLSVQAHQGPGTPVTGIGDGYQFVMYAGPARKEATPANIHHGCFNMRDFDVDAVLAALTSYGLSARGERRLGPLMHYVSLRMPDRGGAEGGTPELYFTDPDGVLLQLQDVSYCGGGGYLGNECRSA